MGREEQTEELDVLASIFPDEITVISDTEIRVAIKLDISDDGDEDETDRTSLICDVMSYGS